jgi:two-component sensor histidine kinase
VTWARVYRVFHIGLAAGLAVVFPGLIGNAMTGMTPAPAWWSAAGISLVALIIVGLVAGGVQGTNNTPLARALLGLVVTLLVSFPMVADAVPARPWVAYLLPAAAASCVLGFAGRAAIAAVVALMGAQVWAQSSEAWDASAQVVALDVVVTLSVAAAVGLPTTAIRTWASRVEEARQAALIAAGAAVATAAAEVEASRWNALMHDEILAVLSTGTRATTAEELEVASHAAKEALARIVEDASPAPVQAAEFGARVRESVLAELPSARVSINLHPEAEPLPAEVADALVSASREVTRNAVRHAWPPAAQHGARAGDESPRLDVLVWLTAGETGIVIVDNGVGFDPEAVPRTRLGLVVSVRGVLASVGGEARWSSSPGRGTTVSLWYRGSDSEAEPRSIHAGREPEAGVEQ